MNSYGEIAKQQHIKWLQLQLAGAQQAFSDAQASLLRAGSEVNYFRQAIEQLESKTPLTIDADLRKNPNSSSNGSLTLPNFDEAVKTNPSDESTQDSLTHQTKSAIPQINTSIDSSNHSNQATAAPQPDPIPNGFNESGLPQDNNVETSTPEGMTRHHGATLNNTPIVESHNLTNTGQVTYL